MVPEERVSSHCEGGRRVDETPGSPGPPPSRGSLGEQILAVGAASVAALGLSAQVAYYFPRVVDDLFISLRYADNLAHGLGPVFNPGERVEGFSSPLWMLLQSAALWLGFEGVTATKLFGCVALLLCLVGAHRVGRELLGLRGTLARAAPLTLVANSYLVNWSLLGLETPAYNAAVLWVMVLCRRQLLAPSRSGAMRLGLSAVLLGMLRPEAPVMLTLIFGATLLTLPAAKSPRAALTRLAVPGSVAALLLLILMLWRHRYYGEWFPNTYRIKGLVAAFDLQRLASLWEQGVGAAERLVYLLGAAGLVAIGLRRRALAPALMLLGCGGFVASVTADWMPSLRHLLPITILCPLGVLALLQACVDAAGAAADNWLRQLARLGLLLGCALLAVAGLELLQIDNRYSPEEVRGRDWVRPKTWSAWQDSWASFQHREPAHVTRMDRYDMGQITQVWGILETSELPLTESWYAGRDIGAVGYYTGVRVFDTAGLITSVVSHDRGWVSHRRVSEQLISELLARRPLAGELYEGWELVLGQRTDFWQKYRLRFGSRLHPHAWLATDRVPPSRSVLLERYRRVVARFPQQFDLHTLYGESVGAAVRRRLRIVEAESDDS